MTPPGHESGLDGDMPEPLSKAAQEHIRRYLWDLDDPEFLEKLREQRAKLVAQIRAKSNFDEAAATDLADMILREVKPALADPEKKFGPPFEHLNQLDSVLDTDHSYIVKRDQEYNASWLARGGVGAFMMLARKWDRLEPMVKKYGYDVFAMLTEKPDRIDDIEDLCRYLILVRCEWQRRLTAGKAKRSG